MRYSVRLWQLGACFLGGNLLVHSLPALPVTRLNLALAMLALTALVAGIAMTPVGASTAGGPGSCARHPWFPANSPVRFGLLLLAATLAGVCWTSLVANHGIESRWPLSADRADLQVAGWIDSIPQQDQERTVFSFRVVTAAGERLPRRLRLSWYDPAPPLEAGQALALTVRLRAPRGLANAGGFDYERWLFLEGIDATGYVRQGSLVDETYGFSQQWLRLRSRLLDAVAATITDTDAVALLQALGLGERGGFTDHHWAVFQRTGTSHLVAVSGLHIGLIAALSFGLTLRVVLWLPGFWSGQAHRIAALTCIVPAAVYAALAGFALPTQRALVMVAVAQLLLIMRRSVLAWNALSLALLAVLIPDPLVSLSASFWLSFGAVALLLAIAAQGRGVSANSTRGPIMNWLLELGRLQWALSLGLAPLVVWFFSQVSLASFVVNLLAIPLFTFLVVPLSLLLILVLATGLTLQPLARIAEWLAVLAWNGLEWAAMSPLAAFSLPAPSRLAFFLAMLAVMMIVIRNRLPARFLVLAGLLPMLFASRSPLQDGSARVSVLDVGHGLAVIVETARHTLLYDAGPVFRSGFDIGAEIVLPALARRGIDHLDLLLISHADNDHAGGMAAVRAQFPASPLLGGPDIEDRDALLCRAGQGWSWDGVRFEVLHPADGFGPEGNESSCVLRVQTQVGSVLITGDIERRAERALVGVASLSADVVVVPHHGSQTSSTQGFVAAVMPKYAVVSADFNNRWGFPREEVVERWESVGAALVTTAEQGALSLCLCESPITMTGQRERQRHYWNATPVSGADDQSAL